MNMWWIVLALASLVLLYFVIRFAVAAAIRTVDNERYERAARLERAARRREESD